MRPLEEKHSGDEAIIVNPGLFILEMLKYHYVVVHFICSIAQFINEL